MAKKPNKPTDKKLINSDFIWDSFIESVVRGEYILVLGSQVVLSKEKDSVASANGDSMQLVFNYVKDDLIEKDEITKGNPSKNFTELSTSRYSRIDVNKSIRDFLESTDENDEPCFKIEEDEIEPQLMALLKEKLFRVVLTITFDPYIEYCMRKVWGDELRVMNIYAEPSSMDFDFTYPYKVDLNNSIPPTLYYVFGKAKDLKKRKFVATDNDAIEVMSKWLGPAAPKNVLSYIQSKRILALGCKLDDWLFRFFWYMLKGDIKNLSEGEVVVSLENNETDLKLKKYLEFSNIYSESDARSFIGKILSYLKEEEVRIKDMRKQKGIFLSYPSEDRSIVKLLYYKLVENRIPVWYDERSLKGGDKYDKKIPEAIAECPVFIPILSAQVKKDLLEGNKRYYNDVEWNHIQMLCREDLGSHVIIPVCIGGYNVRSEYHNKLIPDEFKRTVVNLDEQSTVADLISLIKNNL